MSKNEKLPENIKPEMIGEKRYVRINEGAKRYSVSPNTFRMMAAEANAIINGNPLDIVGGTLYLAGTDVATNSRTKQMRPCSMCQRLILNAQIAMVVMRDVDGNLVYSDPLTWDDDLPEKIALEFGAK